MTGIRAGISRIVVCRDNGERDSVWLNNEPTVGRIIIEENGDLVSIQMKGTHLSTHASHFEMESREIV
jgi:hypothetical protein